MAGRRIALAAAAAVWAALIASPVVLAASPSPAPSSDAAQLCKDDGPPDALNAAIRVACDQIAGVTQSVTQAAGQAGEAAAGAAETALTKWLADGADWMIKGVSAFLNGSSTTPNLDPRQAAAFAEVYGRVAGVALSLSLLIVLIGIVEAVLTQRPGGLRRVVVGIAVSGIGMGVVPVATAILVRITDDLSLYVAGGQTQVVAGGLSAVLQELQQTQPATGAAAFALMSVGLMLGGGLLWLELVTRAALIYLFLGVAPLACAAVQWPQLEGVLRHVLVAGLALILSKLVITITLAVGFAVLGLGGGLQTLLGGMFVIVIAALMPFATARVLPIASEELLQSHQGRMRGWLTSGVATVAGNRTRIATAITSGGATGPALPAPIAPPMGSSGRGAPGRRPQIDPAPAGESGTTQRPASHRLGEGRPRPRGPRPNRGPRSEA